MSAVFISYSSKDRKLAERLKTRLDKAKISNFFAPDRNGNGIEVGLEWQRELKARLATAALGLFVGTRHWNDSAWCGREYVACAVRGLPLLALNADDGKYRAEGSLLYELQGLPLRSESFEADANEIIAHIHEHLDPHVALNVIGIDSPFPGLQYFGIGEAAIYFGRDRDRRGIMSKLDAARLAQLQGYKSAPRLILLRGPSGCGKSSLLRAGVIWTLQLGHRKGDWEVQQIDLGRDPVKTLEATLERAKGWAPAEEPAVAPEVAKQTFLQRVFSRRARKPRQMSVTPTAARQLVLVIDQLEDLFSADRNSERTKSGLVEQCGALLREIARARYVHVLGAVRSDFVARLEDEAGLDGAHVVEVRLDRLHVENLKEIIEGPARKFGYSVDPQLVDEVKRCFVGTDALPLIAFALNKAWPKAKERGDQDKRGGSKALLLSDLPGDPNLATGRIEQALKQHAEDALRSFGLQGEHDFEEALRSAFVPHLIDYRDDGQHLALRARAHAGIPEEGVALLQHLERPEWRLVCTDETGAYSAAHAVLLRHWPRLTAILEAEGANLKRLGTIKAEARRYDNDRRSENLVLEGTNLETVERLLSLRHYQSALTEVDRTYIAECRKKQDIRERDTADAHDSRELALIADLVSPHRRQYLAALGIAGRRLKEIQQRPLPRTDAMLRQAFQSARIKGVIASNQFGLSAMAVSSATATIAVGGMDGTVHTYDWASGRRLCSASELGSQDEFRPVWDLAFSADGHRLVVCADRAPVRLLDATSGQVIASYGQPDDQWTLVRGNHEGSQLAVCSRWGRVQILDNGLRPFAGAQVHRDRIVGCSWSPEGTTLACASWDQTIALWDSRQSKVKEYLSHHNHIVRGVRYLGKGQQLLSWSFDGTACLLDFMSKKLIRLDAGEGPIVAAAVAPETDMICIASSTGSLSLWNASDGKAIGRPFRAFDAAVTGCMFLHDGRTLVASSSKGDVVAHQIVAASSETPKQIYTHNLSSPAVGIRAIGDLVASFGTDGRIVLADPSPPQVEFREIVPTFSRYEKRDRDEILPIADEELNGKLEGIIGRLAKSNQFLSWPKMRQLTANRVVEVQNSNVYLVDATTRTIRHKRLRLLAGDVRVWRATDDGRFISLATTLGAFQRMDLDTMDVIQGTSFSGSPRFLALSEDGTTLVHDLPEQRAIAAVTINGIAQTKSLAATVVGMVAHPNGKLAIITTDGDEVLLWNLEKDSLSTLAGNIRCTGPLAFRGDGRALAIGSGRGLAYIYDFGARAMKKPIGNLSGRTRALAWSPRGTYLLLMSENGRTVVYDNDTDGAFPAFDLGYNSFPRNWQWDHDEGAVLITTSLGVHKWTRPGSLESVAKAADAIGAWTSGTTVKVWRNGANFDERNWQRQVLELTVSTTPSSSRFLERKGRIYVQDGSSPSRVQLIGSMRRWGTIGTNRCWIQGDRGELVVHKIQNGVLRAVPLQSPSPTSRVAHVELVEKPELYAVGYDDKSLRLFDGNGFFIQDYPEVFGFRPSVHSASLVVVHTDGNGRLIPLERFALQGEALLKEIRRECFYGGD